MHNSIRGMFAPRACWVIVGVWLSAVGLVVPSVSWGQDSYSEAHAQIQLRAGPRTFDPLANVSDGETNGPFPAGTSASAGADGVANGEYIYTVGNATEVAFPEVGGFVSVSASGGRLSGFAGLGSETGLGALTSPISGSYIFGTATGGATWQEVATFETDNLNGSDVKLKLNLDSEITATPTYQAAFNNSVWGVGVQATVAAVGPGPFTLSTFDSARGDNLPGGDTSEYQTQSSKYVERTIHIPFGQEITYTLTGILSIGMELTNVQAILNANAAHTALFAISSDDPLLSYTTQSGFVFQTQIPEPSAALLALLMTCGLLTRGRPRA